MAPKDDIGKTEIRKDAVQETVEATATAVGTVATIVTTAVRDIARVVGGYATEVFEIREAVRRARAEHAPEEPRPDVPESDEPR
jgi:malonyl CoA-acyl carrier protein transacylase